MVAIRPPERGLPGGKLNLRGLTRDELALFVARELRAPAYRADQIFRWIHRERASDFAEMSNLPADDRRTLAERCSIAPLTVDAIQRSIDGTRKLRLLTGDGEAIESVLIPNDERGYTQCVSSQVGCALTCRFCATATLGFRRNLHAWEIVDQVHRGRRLLADEAAAAGERWEPRVTNVVYMGMGEPLHNFNQVRASLDLLTDERGEAIAKRRITVSTAGLVPGIVRFVREGLARDYGLAISLNATTDAQRSELMPINTRWPLGELLETLRTVPTERRELTFEYVLLAGVNDSLDDARRLRGLLRGFRCHLNLIPFNDHASTSYRPPSSPEIERFAESMRGGRIPCFVRTPRGRDIGAACGQLALASPTAVTA